MKKCLRAALFLAAAVTLLCVTALAADSGGMYNVRVEPDYVDTVTVTPQTADGMEAATVSTVINSEPKDLYQGAVRVQVTYSGAQPGAYYLILALNGAGTTPTEENIVYIDQTAGTSEAASGAAFNVYPSSLVSGKTYGIYLSSNDSTLSSLTKVASFDYYMPYILGDVDENGYLSSNDALWTLQAAAQNRTLSANAALAADADRSGSLSATDALFILQAAAGNRVL